MNRIVIAALLVGWTPPLGAQQDSLLREAVRLATEGQADSARALVQQRIQTLVPFDSVYAEALYTAGVVAAHNDSALKYFRRVSIEHSTSQWADDALLRISQLAFARGELGSAVRAAERILLDYPFSEILASATYWAGRARLDLGEASEGCGLLRQVKEIAAEDFELANQARFYLQRCPDIGAGTADTADRGKQEARPARPSPTVFAVQVAAVSSVAAADEIMQQLHAQGYESHVVRDAGLLKVRVGRFSRRAQAQRLAAELRRKIGGSPFVVEEP